MGERAEQTLLQRRRTYEKMFNIMSLGNFKLKQWYTIMYILELVKTFNTDNTKCWQAFYSLRIEIQNGIL
jgi:hypothetical protein